ncbi:hypothetical protein KR093_008793 [Drosophila rubida]|uniref:Pre-rRNA-processing protein Ipi1 N-terminal domain-containing protein n=1 Tax=Drosophila rubida TaxID=30044 RepID=A0AAD4KB66_9MUSC|nr:hypothetical protein KR093_008793 [Drosophila rubida]
MGGHHKKNLRAEKAKVKLKGAKLPKGLNVTKTDFKVRKIEIRGQLKEFTSSGERQLNLKEILSRLKHHNLKFRTDALRNVRDAIKQGQSEHLVGHLNELFQGIAAGSLDMEREVRRECYKTLDMLLETLPTSAMVPFFHIISAYLRCAMTHVQPAIQEDSLQLLDVLLQRVPARTLAERSAGTIIGHFIDMISRTRHDTQQANRLLTVRLTQGGQQTTIKWRTKVLLRLQQILGTLQQQPTGKLETKPTARVEHYDVSKPQYYNVLVPMQPDGRSLHVILGEQQLKTANEQLRGYVVQLMPLLLDNWLEVRPQQQQEQHKDQLLLSVDAAEGLHVLLDIMSQLWQLVQQNEATQPEQEQPLSKWLRQNYAQSFLRHFLKDSSYPYQRVPLTATGAVTGKRRKRLPVHAQAGELCVSQNLSLVQLACRFFPHAPPEQHDDFGCLLHYVQQCLRQLRSLSPDEQLRLVAALRALLLDSGLALLQIQAHQMGGVMQLCIEAYVEQHFTTREGCATRMLQLLCEIVQHRQLYVGYGSELQFEPLLKYLPQLLLKPSVADATLTAMSTLCRQQNGILLAALAEHAPQVLANVTKLQVTGAAGQDFEQQKRILNLYYYARQRCEPGRLEAVLGELEQQANAENVASYLKCVLSYD